ncbi:hypothetical protein EVAR_27984_1 [Eumeta japonica]|uniref:Uncharacterized protein n=1 Tax=Eumeta variegata TaxID=151549 RepID=A0A4C1WB31_EUMVA|nr:hypothetical protein EVAR_27984_1 [Eumeta japonica]
MGILHSADPITVRSLLDAVCGATREKVHEENVVVGSAAGSVFLAVSCRDHAGSAHGRAGAARSPVPLLERDRGAGAEPDPESLLRGSSYNLCMNITIYDRCPPFK